MNQEEKILKTCRTVAVVGLSLNAERPSFRVASYLQEQGYKIIPLNPNFSEILGETSYPDLASIGEPVDVIDIFRRTEETPAKVEQAIAKGAEAPWMQEGVVNRTAARRAREAGLMVVMDRCMRKEHLKMQREKEAGGR